jgi:hypothetical protein
MFGPEQSIKETFSGQIKVRIRLPLNTATHTTQVTSNSANVRVCDSESVQGG